MDPLSSAAQKREAAIAEEQRARKEKLATISRRLDESLCSANETRQIVLQAIPRLQFYSYVHGDVSTRRVPVAPYLQERDYEKAERNVFEREICDGDRGKIVVLSIIVQCSINLNYAPPDVKSEEFTIGVAWFWHDDKLHMKPSVQPSVGSGNEPFQLAEQLFEKILATTYSRRLNEGESPERPVDVIAERKERVSKENATILKWIGGLALVAVLVVAQCSSSR